MNDVFTELRRNIHRHPERSGEETGTARIITDYLSKCPGWEVQTGIGGHGVLATWRSGKPGDHTVFRAELDALPIQETTGLEYASVNPGVGHHCGHDGHMAMLCGLAARTPAIGGLHGCISLLFQPAEETGQGAAAMLRDEAMKDWHPSRIIALHNTPGHPLGQLICREGVMLVASTGVSVSFQGTSAHAAHPELGKSPWRALQTLADQALQWPSTLVPLGNSAKVTLAGINMGGPHYGTSPAAGTVWLTLRAYQTETLNMLKNQVAMLAGQLAAGQELRYEVNFTEEFEATVNQGSLFREIRDLAKAAGFSWVEPDRPWSYSEDFGRFGRIAPTLFMGIGSGEQQPVLHASDFDFPDELLAMGIDVLETIVQNYHTG